MIIAEYDLEDNIIDFFENYKILAATFETTVKSIQCTVCRIKKGEVDKTYDKSKDMWVRLYRINVEDDEDEYYS